MPESPIDGDVPTTDTIFGWIEEIFAQGIRRPGYSADRWAERFCAEHFERLGMENVRLEPVEVTRWEPRAWSLEVVVGGGAPVTLDCYPVTYGAPTGGTAPLELELVAYEQTDPGRVAGKAALYDLTMLQVPATLFVFTGDAPADASGRVVDPEGTLEGEVHRLPYPPEMHGALAPSAEAGAAAFIGSLKNYPGDSCRYFLPTMGEPRPIPGVWISASDGDWLREQLSAGPVRIRLSIDSTSEQVLSHNVVGELPGADDEVVMIGSHHDAPWASAVEDGSGMALVLAQASYWAAQPPERRPHRLVFVVQAAHMESAAGMARYIEDHRGELGKVVLHVVLEHAALDCVEDDATGAVVATDRPVPRWFFTSRIPRLEAAVVGALEGEGLHRSMLLAPNAIGSRPTSDGGFYYEEGVPLVNFVTAPFYLFDAMDTLDKVDRESLVPLTRATIRIVESTAGVSAATMRAEDLRTS